ncbi:hypothetical protein [uncultured Thiohalocapsa sp.]|uniref:hypothetical protein n=1 Tax=uncultured Thiohalocapsa sp. TaxID=768990 RepID=UPI0025F17E49|nr:hypothetical protein [uncultured Thiohalocapsa sp.]
MNTSDIPQGVVPLGVVLAGVAFAFGSAVVPHFDSAHRLLALPFGIGVALYALYGVVAALVPQSLADRLGLRILGLHVAMGVLLRASIDVRIVEGWLVLVPALLMVYLLADVYLRRA